jgi:hypothetical protein
VAAFCLQIAAKLFELEDAMSQQGYSEAEIEKRLAAERRNLEAQGGGGLAAVGRQDSHSVAVRKEEQMKVLAAAFGLASDFREGEVGVSEWLYFNRLSFKPPPPPISLIFISSSISKDWTTIPLPAFPLNGHMGACVTPLPS